VRNLDLRAFIHDAVGRGYINPSWYLSGVEGGFEIWRQGTGLASKAFSVTTEVGPTMPLATATAPLSPTVLPPASLADAPRPAPPSGRCTVRWTTNSWTNGLVTSVDVVNNGPPLNGWAVTWAFSADERIGNDWGAEITQDGRSVVARNAPYNSGLARDGTATFGFQAAHGGAPKRPTEVRLNGAPCAIS
jgi:hypothetical protein